MNWLFRRYHHITVLIYTWFTYEVYEPPLRWFMTMNLFVHALMYSYYALKVKCLTHLSPAYLCISLFHLKLSIFALFCPTHSRLFFSPHQKWAILNHVRLQVCPKPVIRAYSSSAVSNGQVFSHLFTFSSTNSSCPFTSR